MELNLVDRQPIVVLNLVDWDGVAHVVEQNFAFLGANCDLHTLTGLKAKCCDFLTLAFLRKYKVTCLSLGLSVPKLNLPVDSTSCCELESV